MPRKPSANPNESYRAGAEHIFKTQKIEKYGETTTRLFTLFVTRPKSFAKLVRARKGTKLEKGMRIYQVLFSQVLQSKKPNVLQEFYTKFSITFVLQELYNNHMIRLADYDSHSKFDDTSGDDPALKESAAVNCCTLFGRMSLVEEQPSSTEFAKPSLTEEMVDKHFRAQR